MTDENMVIKKEDLLAILKPMLEERTPKRGTFVYWLASLIVGCSFGYFGLITLYPISCESNIIFYILGATTAVLTSVVTYFFGSSSGSSDKNAIFKTLADTAMTNAKRKELEEEEEKK